MKYALFGLGVLLIIAGGYFILSGIHNADAQHSLAAVTAGTTALTGGIVMLGFAGVVKSLEDLGQAWLNRPHALPAGRTVPTEETVILPATVDFNPAPAAEPPVPAEAEVAFRQEETPVGAPEVAPSSPVGTRERKAAPAAASAVRPRATPAAPATSIAELRRRVAEDLDVDWPAPAAEPAAKSRPVPAPDPDLTEAIMPPPLDFDGEPPESAKEEAAANVPETEEPAFSEHKIADEPALEPAAEVFERQAEPAKILPKIIGRYEADGILYVMFTDGSIEAQSAEGTRYFKSMAELKASFQS